MLAFLNENNEKLLLKKVRIQTTDNQNTCSKRYLLPETWGNPKRISSAVTELSLALPSNLVK